jgi:hypothetical protein
VQEIDGLVEWKLAGEIEVVGRHFVQHMTLPQLEPGPPR